MNYSAPSDSSFRSLNPATGEHFGTYPLHSDDYVEIALAKGMDAWRWARSVSIEERARLLVQLADRFEARIDELATLITTEMGKPIAEARGEIQKCATTCRITAELGPGWLASLDVPSPARSSVVRFESLGPILAIMPWNFPFWQVIRFFAPAFLAGNTTLIKHAENVPASANALETIFREAGMPAGVLSNLRVHHAMVGCIVADDRIRSVTMTGSVRAGRIVAGMAGSVGKRAVLELGGSDPFIVFADADLDRAVKTAVTARFTNSGQSCVCAKRFFIEETVYRRFVDAYVASARTLKVGDPLDDRNAVGPLARRDLRAGLQSQLDRALADGAAAPLLGGSLDGPGNYFSPTVLTDLDEDSVALREELFGPVAPIVPFRDEADAVRLANSTEFGLAASVWTTDEERAARLENSVESGAVFINDQVRSDAHISFGGSKASGYGRELGSLGIKEFTNAKTVWRG